MRSVTRGSKPVSLFYRHILWETSPWTGVTIEGVPADWTVWNDEPTNLVLVYQPDVFDSAAFPAPCLPTIYATHGRQSRRPGRSKPDPEDPWIVTLFLEPAVDGQRREYDDRETAKRGALDLARAFAAGEIAYRDLYQQPREAYLDRLDALTGRET